MVDFSVSLYELVVGGADALEGPDSKTMMSATTSLSYPSGTAAPTPPDQAPPHSAVSDFPICCVKGVFDVTTLMASPPLTHPIVSECRCFVV